MLRVFTQNFMGIVDNLYQSRLSSLKQRIIFFFLAQHASYFLIKNANN